MKALFWKLFGGFWLTTFVILTVSVLVSFRIAGKDSGGEYPDPRESDALLQEIIQSEGLDGLKSHIRDADNFPPGITIYIIDRDAKDILGRTLPERLQRRAAHMLQIAFREPRPDHISDRHLRRLRDSFLVSPAGEPLLALPGPVPPPRFGVFSSRHFQWVVLVMAAAISFLVFWLLSRSLTRPIARISDTARRLAQGDMSARVGGTAYARDEIGQLAAQFDRMAGELESQSKMRREMFRNIAHELRAPLTRLQVATELLERRPDNAAGQIGRVRYEIDRIENLTRQVLALARAEQVGEADATTSLGPVLEQIVRDARFEAEAREVRLSYQAPGGDATVKGRPDSIASAIENVVRNAVQMTPAGGVVEVAVSGSGGAVRGREATTATTNPASTQDRLTGADSIARQLQPGDGVVVTVSDTGPGVDESQLEKIFEPFFRIDTNRPGAGIGLAIALRVLHQVGGEIAASNRAGGGLQVAMRFPSANSGTEHV